MKIEPKNSHAAARALFCVHSSVAAVLVAASLLGGGLAGAAGDAPVPQRRDEVQRSNNDSRERGEQRDGRADEQRRAMQERADASRRNGRLTPDERRDLRRQINEAGQDIYSTPPRR
ncbi:hypothetical protein ACFDR9_003789 [Janthinobacterium sp. CG_23.3]|uniref:hypothetical protein n=1 Tax=unclassified Janthinobacterium TaxID=2610881 RepID=UPI0003497D7A|nr:MULTISPECIES: hypothetical protein [unclassified Janthinobacterium]MEC5164033.1 hypothetical protein [Janthinobacterium sp. CG_S6]